jgi:hypothetical protein
MMRDCRDPSNGHDLFDEPSKRTAMQAQTERQGTTSPKGKHSWLYVNKDFLDRSLWIGIEHR